MAQFLKAGTYEPKTAKVVTVWPKPDVNGDGETLFRDIKDQDGAVLGSEIVTTDQGEEVRHYLPPAGFVNVRSREPGADGNADNYVRTDRNGQVVRDVNGAAIGIREGCALVEHANGSTELLTTDYAQVLFGRAHTQTGEPDTEPAPAGSRYSGYTGRG